MQQMPGFFNTIIQSAQQTSSQYGAQMHKAVSWLAAGLTDPKELIDGLDYSRLIVDEFEDELMAESKDGQTTTTDNEMEVVANYSAEQLEKLLGGMTEATKKECRLYAQ